MGTAPVNKSPENDHKPLPLITTTQRTPETEHVTGKIFENFAKKKNPENYEIAGAGYDFLEYLPRAS